MSHRMPGAQGQAGPIATGQSRHKDVIARYTRHLNSRRYVSPEVISTGFPKLDEYIGGFHPGELTIVASRPGVGRSALALQFAYNAALLGASVVYFSLEMSSSQLALRLLGQRSKIPIRLLRQGEEGLDDHQLAALAAAADEVQACNLQFDDTHGLSIAEMEAVLKAGVKSSESALCVIDYMQLVKPLAEKPPDGQTGKRDTANQKDHEIEQIACGMKSLAESLRIPVIALSALSPAIGRDARRTGRPLLQDFRSPSIVSGADTILLLDRSLTPGDADGDRRPAELEADIIIAKNGHGVCRDHRVLFDAESVFFYEGGRAIPHVNPFSSGFMP